MSDKKEFEKFRNEAKGLVDVLFDNGLFIDTITRDDMISVEDLIQFYLSSSFDSHLTMEKIVRKLK